MITLDVIKITKLRGLPFGGWLSLMPEINDIEDQFIDEDQELLLSLSKDIQS